MLGDSDGGGGGVGGGDAGGVARGGGAVRTLRCGGKAGEDPPSRP